MEEEMIGHNQRDSGRSVLSEKGIAQATELIAGAAAATPWMEWKTLRERDLRAGCGRGRGWMQPLEENNGVGAVIASAGD
jgi:hypothetical protein